MKLRRCRRRNWSLKLLGTWTTSAFIEVYSAHQFKTEGIFLIKTCKLNISQLPFTTRWNQKSTPLMRVCGKSARSSKLCECLNSWFCCSHFFLDEIATLRMSGSWNTSTSTLREIAFKSARQMRRLKSVDALNTHRFVGFDSVLIELALIIHVQGDNSSKVCSIYWQVGCYKIIEKAGVDEEGETLKACDCLPSCNSIDYDFNEFHVKIKNQDEGNITRSLLLVYFTDDEFIVLKRYASFGTITLLSNLGGFLGLFLGVSVLSFVEVFYFFVVRFLNNLWWKGAVWEKLQALILQFLRLFYLKVQTPSGLRSLLQSFYSAGTQGFSGLPPTIKFSFLIPSIKLLSALSTQSSPLNGVKGKMISLPQPFLRNSPELT